MDGKIPHSFLPPFPPADGAGGAGALKRSFTKDCPWFPAACRQHRGHRCFYALRQPRCIGKGDWHEFRWHRPPMPPTGYVFLLPAEILPLASRDISRAIRESHIKRTQLMFRRPNIWF